MLNQSDLGTVMNQCRVELTGVSDAQLKSTMYEVMDEFFRDTQSWKESVVINVVPVTSTPTTPQLWQQALTYPIASSEGQIISLDGVINTNCSPVPALLAGAGGDNQNSGGVAVRLQNPPNQAQQYTVTVSKTVSLPLDRHGFPIAPSWVLEKWHLAIKVGILGALMNQKNKSYSDDNGAKYNLAKFRQFIQNVRSATLRANTKGASAWRYPQGFRTISQKGGVPVYGTGNDWSG